MFTFYIKFENNNFENFFNYSITYYIGRMLGDM